MVTSLPLFLPTLEGLSPVVGAHLEAASGAALVRRAVERVVYLLYLACMGLYRPAAPNISCPSGSDSPGPMKPRPVCLCAGIGHGQGAKAGRTAWAWNRANYRV